MRSITSACGVCGDYAQHSVFQGVVSDLDLIIYYLFLILKCVLCCMLSFTFYAFVVGFISDFDLNANVFDHFCVLVLSVSVHLVHNYHRLKRKIVPVVRLSWLPPARQ